jgi:gamma-aminobutyric acid type B receptor
MLPCAILTTVNVIVLVLWTVLDPLRWERKQISPTESYGHCSTDEESNIWLVSICFLGFVNMTALLLANVEAYRARHVSVEYGESKYIAIAMVLMIQIFVVGLPILFLVYEQPSAFYFIITVMVSTVSLSTLLLLFVPKIWVWAHNTEARTSNRGQNSVPGLNIEKRFGASSVGELPRLSPLSRTLLINIFA